MRAIALALTVGCAPEAAPPSPEPADSAPEFVFTDITCQGPLDDEEWLFQAEVRDPDGDDDVRSVTAFVYDEVSEEAIEQVALAPLEGGGWEARLPSAQTPLDCGYLRYSADFIAVDQAGESTQTTHFVQASLAR